MFLTSSNTRSLNNKLGTIRNIEKIDSDWSSTSIEIIQNSNSINEIYSKIYKNYMNNEIDLDVFINKFDNYIIKLYSNMKDENITKKILSLNKIVSDLQIFTLIFNFKQLKLNDKSVEYYMYDTVSKLVFNDDKSIPMIDNLIVQLIINKEKVQNIFPVIGKILTNGELNNNSKNKLLCDFKLNLIQKLNKHLKDFYTKNKINIHHVYENIYDIGTFMDTYFIPNSSEDLYKICFSEWATILINNLTINSNIPIIIGYLQNTEQYIGCDKIALDITEKIKEIINNKICQFKPYKNHLTNSNFYNRLVEITVILEMLLNGWDKYNTLKNDLIKIYDTLFTEDIIEYYHLECKKVIINYCLDNNDINKFPKSNIASIITTLRIKETDKSLLLFYNNLQNRYVTLFSKNKINSVKIMLDIDKNILDKINNYLDENIDIKHHVLQTVNKIKNILDDINASIIANNELKNVSIKLIDSFKNEVNIPFERDNINYVLTSGGNNWSSTVQHIANSFDIKYDRAINCILNPFTEFYKHKCK
jgi:hypothetical protein